ncbi:DUF2690 domain-containing protein [Streptomyces pactum]|uniref:DUF2690 domain-containing protein n=1 Tax=Streptomyces pactum TaxID=68249 RepID=A0ABS0NMS9_9ACTN|nr:DUF2690 domain-containing protein [Streptomyces pactum]MBH5336504.1 DUF2690 domain-containing protein [Streptomyces pactum]
MDEDPHPGSGDRATARPAAAVARLLERIPGRARPAIGAAVVAVLLIVSAVLLFGGGEEDGNEAAKPTRSTEPLLPPGVKCVGQGCTGKDPEDMGCGDDRAETTADAMVGTVYIEVRYSEVCRAAWARIAQAGPGDAVRITRSGQDGPSGHGQTGRAGANGGGYTRMLAVQTSAEAKACATLVNGETGCTRPTPRP